MGLAARAVSKLFCVPIDPQLLCCIFRPDHCRLAPQIIPSRDVKVAGLLGPASPMEKKGMSVAETPVGLGGTTQW